MNKSPSVQSADRTKAVQVRSVEEICIQQNLDGNKVGSSPHLHLKINSGCHARENLFEETISENSQIGELHETINI